MAEGPPPSSAPVSGTGNEQAGNPASLPGESHLPSPQQAATARDYAAHPGFRNQPAFRAIGLDRALANFARAKGGSVPPGTGVSVGFLDTGILLDHIAFRFRSGLTEEHLAPEWNPDFYPVDHGTSVASIVGADRDRAAAACDGCVHGIAWGADLKMFGLTGIDDDHLSERFESRWGADLRWALSHDLDILNVSLGSRLQSEWFTEGEIRRSYSFPIRELAQTGATDKTIVVWAAGNSNGKRCETGTPNCVNDYLNARSPEFHPGLAAHIKELRGHFIAVVAADGEGRISSFSNRCGIAAEWCITAPGEDITGAGYSFSNPSNKDWENSDGTSLSAPMVAGSLALMKHYFRHQLSSAELVTRLYATADKTGRYADRAIYGQGMLDLGAAVSPVGEVTVATADAADGAPLAETRVRLGGAFGDALRDTPAGQEIVAFDRLGAPFWYALDSLFEHTRAPGGSRARFDDFLAAREEAPPSSWADLALATPRAHGGFQLGPLTSTWREYSPGASFAYLAHAANAAALSWSGADSGLAAAFFATPRGNGLGDDANSPGRTSGAALSWRPATRGANFGFGLHAGWLAEEDALLGSSATGAFGQWSTDTMFTGFDIDFSLGSEEDTRHGWRILASAEVGVSEPTPQGGMVEDLPPLTASAFALRAERAFPDGARLRFSLAQPLRIESDAGGAMLSVPDLDQSEGAPRGVMVQKRLTTGLTPSGRQLDASVRWDRPLAAKNTELRLGATWTRHPGHNAAAEPELLLLGGLRHSF